MFRILVVEDHQELRQLFVRVLEKNGYTALSASNGQEALKLMENSYVDLIICDIMMPVMDGYELVRTIRESGMTMPVLMITAKGNFDDMREGFLSGTDDYMVKPVNVNEMVLRVSALLRRAQRLFTLFKAWAVGKPAVNSFLSIIDAERPSCTAPIPVPMPSHKIT